MGRGRGWEPFGNREIASCWAVIIVGHVVNKMRIIFKRGDYNMLRQFCNSF
jgi:hypothetical protein